MIEKMRYELLSHNFSLNKDLNNLNKKRLPIVAWARDSHLRGYCRPNTTIKEVSSDTPSHKHPLNKKRLPIVV